MSTANDPGERYRYLSLGFFAQRLVVALIKFLEEGRREGLKETLTEAIESLKGVDKLEVDVESRAFRTYEEIRTLHDVSDTNKTSAMIGILQDLRSNLARPVTRERRVRAERAIRWFGLLQNQALRNYSDASESIPRGVRELCQTR